MNYIFGDRSRANYYLGNKALKKLSLVNLFFLKEKDVIFVTRTWSMLIEIIFCFRNRPKIILLADGLITHSNCFVKHNSYHLPLFKKINGDVLLVRQSMESIPNHLPSSKIISDISYIKEKKISEARKIFLIFGNDPYISIDKSSIFKNLNQINSMFGKKFEIYYSSGSRKLENEIKHEFPEFINYGKFSKKSFLMSDTLFITTPSTVSHDLFLNGASVLSFEGIKCETMDMLYLSSRNLVVENGSIKFTHIKCTKIEKSPFNFDQIQKTSEENKIDFKSIKSQLNFFKPFVLRRFLGELRQLLFG